MTKALEVSVKAAYEQALTTGVTLELLTQLVDQVREAERAQCCSIANQALKGAVMSKYVSQHECAAARDMAQRIVNALHFR